MGSTFMIQILSDQELVKQMHSETFHSYSILGWKVVIYPIRLTLTRIHLFFQFIRRKKLHHGRTPTNLFPSSQYSILSCTLHFTSMGQL